MAKISVIVPVYKVEQYIHRCVDSILNQTFTDFELILVDDGSPDNCGKICDEYEKQDNRIHVIHQENGGLSAARNAGLDWIFANSDSDWVIFIDSDDWIHPVMLEKLYDANITNKTSISSCSFERTTREEPVIDVKEINTYVSTPEKFYLESNVNATIACAKLYKKECFSTLRYPVGKLHEDEFTTYKILFEYDAISIVDAPLYMYYQNSEGIMNSAWNPKRLDVIDAYKEQLHFFNYNRLLYIEKQQASFFLQFLCTSANKIKKSNFSYLKKRKFLCKIKKELKFLLKKHIDFIFPDCEVEWYISLVYPGIVKIKSHLNKLKIKK